MISQIWLLQKKDLQTRLASPLNIDDFSKVFLRQKPSERFHKDGRSV